MVTLLGFFFILSNVICLEIWMPDLVGPVRTSLQITRKSLNTDLLRFSGTFLVILQLCVWSMDVFDYGQCRRQTSTKNWYIKWPR
jgi:hypothetical protein